MLVVSYADFFANPAQYRERAETSGIKILPKKREKKNSRRVRERLDALNAVVGIIPPDIDADALLEERGMPE